MKISVDSFRQAVKALSLKPVPPEDKDWWGSVCHLTVGSDSSFMLIESTDRASSWEWRLPVAEPEAMDVLVGIKHFQNLRNLDGASLTVTQSDKKTLVVEQLNFVYNIPLKVGDGPFPAATSAPENALTWKMSARKLAEGLRLAAPAIDASNAGANKSCVTLCTDGRIITGKPDYLVMATIADKGVVQQVLTLKQAAAKVVADFLEQIQGDAKTQRDVQITLFDVGTPSRSCVKYACFCDPIGGHKLTVIAEGAIFTFTPDKIIGKVESERIMIDRKTVLRRAQTMAGLFDNKSRGNITLTIRGEGKCSSIMMEASNDNGSISDEFGVYRIVSPDKAEPLVISVLADRLVAALTLLKDNSLCLWPRHRLLNIAELRQTDQEFHHVTLDELTAEDVTDEVAMAITGEDVERLVSINCRNITPNDPAPSPVPTSVHSVEVAHRTPAQPDVNRPETDTATSME